MAARARALSKLYTAQEVARFCEVDLKTVHHWADRGKVVHHRTDGRHLRFRRNDLVRFLKLHGYPMPGSLVHAKPLAGFASVPGVADEDLAKRLASRFVSKRYPCALAAIAAAATAPDVWVFSLADPTLGGLSSIRALKEGSDTSWIFLAVFAAEDELSAAREAGADIALNVADLARLGAELGKTLSVLAT